MPAFEKNEWYSEGWDQLFYFKDGTFLAVQISVVNVGLGSRHAGVIGLVVSPDGRASLLKQSRSRGEWEYSEDKLDLKIAKHNLTGEFPDYRVRIDKDEGQIDLEFSSLAQPWVLGRTIERGKDYRYASFYAPIASATGRYRLLAEGDDPDSVAWSELEDGRGFAMRYVNAAAIYDLIHNATHIVSIGDGPIQPVIYLEMDSTGEIHSSVALFEGGRLIHETRGVDVAIDNRIETTEDDQRSVPHRVHIDIDQDDYSLTGSVVVEKFLVRFDPVDHLKPFVRTLVKILNTPIQYRYLASYDLVFETEERELKLNGAALMDHVVMRHVKAEPVRRRNKL